MSHMFLLPAVQFSCWLEKTDFLCLYMLLCPPPSALSYVAGIQLR